MRNISNPTYKSPSVESALLYQSFQRTFLQQFSVGLISYVWRKGFVFLHRFICVHFTVLLNVIYINQGWERGASRTVAVYLWSLRWKAWPLWEKACGKGAQPWQPTTAIRHLLNESQLKAGICLGDCNPLRQKHTDKLFTKSAQQDSQQLTFQTGFQAKNKTTFVVMKKRFPKVRLIFPC